jgi:hypothetical protein
MRFHTKRTKVTKGGVIDLLTFARFVFLCFEIFAACAHDLRSEDYRNRIFLPPRRKGAKVMGKSEKTLAKHFHL